MPRYIDAELLDPEDFENCTPYQAREIIEDIPIADVVPRSEVMKVVGEYYNKCDECRVKIAAAVAREIIADIESVMYNRFSNIMLGEDIKLRIAELKKKYTEGSR